MEYEYNVIFNSVSQSRSGPSEDTDLASEFVKVLIDKMKSHGINGYNPDEDAPFGSSIFEQMLMVDETLWTIVVITPGFSDDSWVTYKQQHAIMRLIKGDRLCALIPIAVNTNDLPGELSLFTPLVFSGEHSWQDSSKWERLKDILLGRIVYTRTSNLDIHDVDIEKSNVPDADNDDTTSGSAVWHSQGMTETSTPTKRPNNADKDDSGQGHGETQVYTDTSERSENGASSFRGISMSSVGKVFNGALRFVKLVYEADKIYN